MSCRAFATEYVARHLHGLSVLSTLASDVATTHTTPLAAASSPSPAPIIATHNGNFHCDEALACGLLRHTHDYAGATVLRTRDAALLPRCDVVVDVGGVYDAATRRYDHHQPSFHETMTTTTTKTTDDTVRNDDSATTTRETHYNTRLSSAGLVYRHHGRDILQCYLDAALASPHRETILRITGWPPDRHTLPAAELDVLYDALYANLIEQVDAVDNGIDAVALADPDVGALTRRYKNSAGTLADRVAQLHPWWNETPALPPLPPQQQQQDATTNTTRSSNDEERARVLAENVAFVQAVELTTQAFFDAATYYAFSWLPARALVARAFDDAPSVHPSGAIVVLRERFCPWKDHLLQLEHERGCVGRVLYVVFSDGKSWRVQAVPQSAQAQFVNRKPLPYRGLRDAELSAACGIDGGIFVHVSGFIAGMATYDGAVRLAVRALEVE